MSNKKHMRPTEIVPAYNVVAQICMASKIKATFETNLMDEGGILTGHPTAWRERLAPRKYPEIALQNNTRTSEIAGANSPALERK